MSVVEAGKSVAATAETRPFSEVQKGYTCFADGDVLLAKITPCFENGKIAEARVRSEFAFGSTEFHVLRPQPQKLDTRYLVNFLRRDTVLIEGERKMTGSVGQRRVPNHFLESLQIPLPDLAEQRRIAAILDKADALRVKRREALDMLDGLANSIFINMFSDPISNVKRWRTVCLSQLANRIQIGPFGSQLHEEDYVDNGIPLVNPMHIRNGHICADVSFTITEEKHKELDSYHLEEGDLILGRRGEMGRCAVVSSREKGWLCGTGSLFVRLKADEVDPVYLAQVISSPSMRKHLGNVAQGVTMANLNKNIVGSLTIPVPPMERQRLFKAAMNEIGVLKASHGSSLEQADNLFSSLQHRAFTGAL
ncbi:restriction endonuclease subunit S [Caballeronia novacaledonica]|nr:restriction endonuclease subunit S [Caballeronia novacaledonica]